MELGLDELIRLTIQKSRRVPRVWIDAAKAAYETGVISAQEAEQIMFAYLDRGPLKGQLAQVGRDVQAREARGTVEVERDLRCAETYVLWFRAVADSPEGPSRN
jgi:hypothetical protein